MGHDIDHIGLPDMLVKVERRELEGPTGGLCKHGGQQCRSVGGKHCMSGTELIEVRQDPPFSAGSSGYRFRSASLPERAGLPGVVRCVMRASAASAPCGVRRPQAGEVRSIFPYLA